VQLVQSCFACPGGAAPFEHQQPQLFPATATAQAGKLLAVTEPPCSQSGVDLIVLAPSSVAPPGTLALVHQSPGVDEEAC
jgi:hypothetical protein